jgi:hypothetical protein
MVFAGGHSCPMLLASVPKSIAAALNSRMVGQAAPAEVRGTRATFREDCFHRNEWKGRGGRAAVKARAQRPPAIYWLRVIACREIWPH